jgi:sugar-specific transcriptional regulator TrmB
MDNSNAGQASPDTAILRKAGLTESQAKGYLALIEHGTLSPTELADKTGESRTNGYMICDKLEKLGLAAKKEGKKALYSPTHPSALEALAERRRKAVQRNEQEVKQNVGTLIDYFYRFNSTPGIEFDYGGRRNRENSRPYITKRPGTSVC